MPSLYAKYLKEREDTETYEIEEGFITYSITGEECYIQTIYVMPDFRRLDIATRMADYVTKKAKLAGCTFLSGTVDPTTNGATESMRALLYYGFKLNSLKDGAIILVKKI
jgi:ribosomal protein S18 acetylase RimI-like enzyme